MQQLITEYNDIFALELKDCQPAYLPPILLSIAEARRQTNTNSSPPCMKNCKEESSEPYYSQNLMMKHKLIVFALIIEI